jgi:hypothetical protein
LWRYNGVGEVLFSRASEREGIPVVNGLLAAVFALHLAVFAGLLAKRRRQAYLLLCGTFAALTALYAAKVAGADPEMAGISLQAALRALALACTATYLTLWLRRTRALSATRGPR